MAQNVAILVPSYTVIFLAASFQTLRSSITSSHSIPSLIPFHIHTPIPFSYSMFSVMNWTVFIIPSNWQVKYCNEFDCLQVLITKLRSATNAETQQYRKASKALVVLIPLLGITYILVIVGPTQGVPADIYAYLRAILLSTQVIA